jgi:hypothetical protein
MKSASSTDPSDNPSLNSIKYFPDPSVGYFNLHVITLFKTVGSLLNIDVTAEPSLVNAKAITDVISKPYGRDPSLAPCELSFE